MRYQSRMLLFGGLLVASQMSLCGTFGAEPAAVAGYDSPTAPAQDSALATRAQQPLARAHLRAADPTLSDAPGGYRFRPWQGTSAVDLRRRGPAAAPARFSRYRFRPLPAARRDPAERQVQYRPLQIRIPDRYVFRPLRPAVRQRPSLHEQSSAAVSRHFPGGAYPYYAANPFAPRAGFPYTAVAHPQAQWVDPWRAYAPVSPPPWPAYPPRLAQGMAPPPWPAYPPRLAQGMAPPPRPAYPPRLAQGMAPPPWVRAWPDPMRPRARATGYPPRYAWRQPRPYVPAPVPAWAYGREAPYPAYGVWPRTAQRPPLPPAALNPYATDWYDGRSDGEGAWYRLVLGSAPAVSQFWAPPPVTAERID